MAAIVRRVVQGEIVVAGAAAGCLIVSPAPLSFWGGYDAATGEVIDRRHPLSGQRLAGHVLALPWTRGSSTTTAVLLEAVRLHQAPAAIVLPKVDSFIALASIVAGELYGRAFPVIVIAAAAALTDCDRLPAEIDASGVVRLG